MPLSTRVKYISFITVFNLLTYFGIQQIATSNAVELLSPLDQSIPLVPEFIWIYNSLIPVLLISTIFLIKTKRIFLAACLSFLTATVVLDIFYIILPCFYPREAFEIIDASTWFLDMTRQIDGSNNTFPSGHVTLSWLLFWSTKNTELLKGNTKLKIIYALWAIGISISTLTLKQHYIVDVASGFFLAWGCWAGSLWFVEKSQQIQKSLRQTEACAMEPEQQLAE